MKHYKTLLIQYIKLIKIWTGLPSYFQVKMKIHKNWADVYYRN